MKRKIHVIMTMAGEGSRFAAVGIDMPKPLIEFNGLPLYRNSLKSVDGIELASITFVVRKEHIDKYEIDKKITEVYPHAVVLAIEETTRGAAETAFFAVRNLILSNIADFNDSIVIMDCDVMVYADKWKKMITNTLSDGVLLSFTSDKLQYSYALTHNNIVKETAEKKVISSNALTSPYFIRKIEDFIDSFHRMEQFYLIEQNKSEYKEMYMSTLYNFLISFDKKVTLVKADKVISLGTPEELEIAKTKLQ